MSSRISTPPAKTAVTKGDPRHQAYAAAPTSSNTSPGGQDRSTSSDTHVVIAAATAPSAATVEIAAGRRPAPDRMASPNAAASNSTVAVAQIAILPGLLSSSQVSDT